MEVPDRIGEEAEKLSCHLPTHRDMSSSLGFSQMQHTVIEIFKTVGSPNQKINRKNFPRKAIFRMSEITRKPSRGQILIKSDALLR